MSARRARDEGFTLVELLVVLVLLSVVGTILTSTVIGATRATARQQDQTATLNAAKVAMERMTRDVRGANSMTYASPRKLTLVATAAGQRRSTTLEVVAVPGGTELQQVDVVRDLATGVETTDTRTVLGGLALGVSEALFTYSDGSLLPLAPVDPVATPVTYPPGDVRTIGIRVLLNRAFGDPIELYQLVSIRNLEA